MQIEKIISGAQSGADRAALDFAIEYEIDHGGWVPEGRRAEDGVVPAGYRVSELRGAGYAERTEQNVIDSDATLIVSRGQLSGGSLLTRQFAEQHGKPCLHINFFEVIAFDAAIDIHEWLRAHDIKTLNVAGPRASKDPEIYKSTYELLETVFHIDLIFNTMPGLRQAENDEGKDSKSEVVLPATVAAAVEELVNQLPAMDKARIASLPVEKVEALGDSWGRHVQQQFGLDGGNDALLSDCQALAGKTGLSPHEAAMLILRQFWKKLKQSGHLRVVK
ncbi:MAG: putative molybdenum carrier protein [Thermodesulfobacteriota bacterium]